MAIFSPRFFIAWMVCVVTRLSSPVAVDIVRVKDQKVIDMEWVFAAFLGIWGRFYASKPQLTDMIGGHLLPYVMASASKDTTPNKKAVPLLVRLIKQQIIIP